MAQAIELVGENDFGVQEIRRKSWLHLLYF